MEATTEKLWHQLPPAILPSPVFALATGRDGFWVGGTGGIAWSPTTDAIGEWQPRISGLPLSSVTALLNLDGLLLAGGMEGIARSCDGGFTWQPASLEDGMASVTAFAASPHFAEDQTALAATLANGILRTDDGGRTWKNVAFGLESFEVTALAWGPGSTILAATADGLYRSPNAGRAWRRVYEEEELGIDAMLYLPNGTVLATLGEGGLLRSDDGGSHWSRIENTVRNLHAVSLLVTPNKALLLGTLEDGLLRSTDNGASWQPVHDAVALTLAAGSSILYAGTGSGVCVSYNDGLSWRDLPCPPIHDLRRLLIYRDQPLLAGPYAGLLRYTPTHGWQALPDSPQPLTATALAPDGSLWLSSPDGLTRTDGKHTQQIIQGSDGHVAHITFRAQGETWQGWAGSADGSLLLRSLDSGKSWHPLRPPFGVLPLAALQAVPDRLFAATYDPRQYRITIWFSLDNGENWERGAEAETQWPLVSTGSQPPLITTGDVMLLQYVPGQWSKLVVGRDGSPIRRVVSVQSGEQTILLALTTNAIQRYEGEDAGWQRDDQGVPIEQVVDIAATPRSLYILLAGGRVWKRAL